MNNNDNNNNSMLFNIMGTCHGAYLIGNKLIGDTLDVAML